MLTLFTKETICNELFAGRVMCQAQARLKMLQLILKQSVYIWRAPSRLPSSFRPGHNIINRANLYRLALGRHIGCASESERHYVASKQTLRLSVHLLHSRF